MDVQYFIHPKLRFVLKGNTHLKLEKKEKRISNFLLWQLAYTELYFPDLLWPDFDDDEFEKALLEYSTRTRRFGDKSNFSL